MVNDPYSILGISPSASDDEVKKAYRDLSRKYHPDSYANNPLANLAEERFKEVQEAYDQIMKERSGGGRSYGGNQSYGGGQNYGGNQAYQNNDARYQAVIIILISDATEMRSMYLPGCRQRTTAGII